MSHPVTAPWAVKAAVACAVALGGSAALAARSSAARAAPPTATERLVEAAECAGAPSANVPTGGATQTVTVSVPRAAFIHLDAAGRVISASTNTGCAPRTLDTVYLFRADGSIVEAPPAVIAHLRWTGNFRDAGAEQPQHELELAD